MKIKIKNNKEYIFDLVRKKYVVNQPEEWVRQHMVEFLHKQKGYPISLMTIEKKTNINNMKDRNPRQSRQLLASRSGKLGCGLSMTSC